MKAISVWSPKGGAGKTTITLNVAGCLHFQGLEVLVIDLDPQQSSVWLHSRGGLPFQVVAGMPQERPTADVVLFDHAPGIGEVPTAPRIIMPIRPSALDVHSASLMAGQLSQEQALYRVTNAVDARRSEEREVSLELKAAGAFTVADRSIYPRTLGEGVTVWQRQYTGYAAARNEIKLLTDEVIK